MKRATLAVAAAAAAIMLAAGLCRAQERPRVSLDTSVPPVTGEVIRVPAGASLQAAIDRARQGDAIELEPGATYVGTFAFRDKPEGDGKWLTVRTEAHALLPPPGSRVTPEQAALMPRLVPPDNLQVLDLYPTFGPYTRAHHVRFVGLELAPNPAHPANGGLVKSGTNGSWQATAAQAPTDIVYDRCYIHGLPGKNATRGLYINSARTAVVDSWLSDFKGLGYEAQAILIVNSPGVVKVSNCLIEGAGENLMVGGVDTRILGLVPGDIEVVGNHFYKPLSWCERHPSYAGFHWAVKNLFELKNAQRVLVENNLFENHWVDAQSGPAVLFTPRNQDGRAPWSAVRDVTFLNNVVRNVPAGIAVLGTDDRFPSGRLERVAIVGNRFEGLAAELYLGFNGRVFQVVGGSLDLRIERNVAVSAGVRLVLVMDGAPSERMVVRDNILSRGAFGVFGSGSSEGTASLARYAPGAMFEGNLLLGNPMAAARYPAGNYFTE